MRLLSALRVLSLFGVVIATPSCTASLELDRFRTSEAPIQAIEVNYFDVSFTAKGMQSHINEYLEIRVVDKSNRIAAKAVYNDIFGPDFAVYMASVVPKANAPYRLDFWADHNLSSRYDGIEGGINDKDHAWRRELKEPLPDDMRLVGSRYELLFIHDTAFVDIATDVEGKKVSIEDELLPFELGIVGAGAYAGKMLETRVVDKAAGRLVGLYRQGRAKETFKARVAGVLDEETQYEISTYVDLDGSGGYSEGDPSWKQERLSNETGIALELNTATLPQSPITTGAP